MIYVIKRDGRKRKFNEEKIKDAVLAAFNEVDGEITDYAQDKASNIASYISNYISENDLKKISVEEIQNLVEQGLMSTKRKDVAKAFILYRQERSNERDRKSELTKIIKCKIDASDVENQNANVDEYSFGGRKGEAASAVLKDFALKYCMSEESREAHENNEIYIHDLDSYALGCHNCLSVPFDDLLANGFNTRQTDIRPANSINTAFQLIAVIFQLQSLQQFGGVSATHIDWTMIPYVRKSFAKHYMDGIKYFDNYISSTDESNPIEFIKDATTISINDNRYRLKPNIYNYALDMTKRELKQAVEGMYHNLNTLQSRSGNQLPFTSINYGTCTLIEGQLVIEALLNGSINGVGKLHRTPVFPCGIFQCMKGVNQQKGEPNYYLFKLALESTAKRLYPNYANVDWSGNIGYDRNDPKTYFSTMGCRTANGFDINGFGQLKDGRGNICPVTIILPTLAMEAKEITKLNEINDKIDGLDYKQDIIDTFLTILDENIHKAKDMLIERFEYICNQSPKAATFMYENNTMAGYIPEEGIRSALKHGTLAMGQLGLAECLQILIGKDHTTEEGMELAKKIESLFQKRCKEFKEKYYLNFGVYYSPAENLCYTAMKKFKAKYGEIENVSDKDYFTNSMHVPVSYHISPFDKIDIESQLTGYSSAGCITYTELDGSMSNNIDALEELVHYAMDKDIPYFAINVPNDTCLDCGFTGEFNDKCPECGSNHIQQLRRVTGYLTGNFRTAFNPGKIKETEDRFRHSQMKVTI